MFPPQFVELFTGWKALIGMAALIAVLINLLKVANVVQEGDSVKWSAGLNLLGLVTIFLLKLWKPDLSIEMVDGTAGSVATVLTVILTYISQLGWSKLAHFTLKKIPWIGKSFSEVPEVPGPEVPVVPPKDIWERPNIK